MNHQLRQEFKTMGFDMARAVSSRLEKYGLRLVSSDADERAKLSEAITAWLTGFLGGLGFDVQRVDASLAQGVTAFQRFYTSETLKN